MEIKNILKALGIDENTKISDIIWGPELEMQKTAVIFGITGMDGSYLADLLLSKNYKVVGVKRRSSSDNKERIRHLKEDKNYRTLEGDLTDYASLVQVFKSVPEVNEVYNLAAQSHVGTSFKQPGLTWDVTGKGCMNILQCLVDLDMKHVKFYQASSSEMFGAAYSEEHLPYVNHGCGRIPEGSPTLVRMGIKDGMRKFQDENTKFLPQSPYAISKCAAHMSVRLYREAYGIHGSCGILFNHEGARRGENFVTRKITKWLGECHRFLIDNHDSTVADLVFSEDHIIASNCRRFSKLRLGNLDAQRDWGHAKDYVRAMWMMLQQENPDDYVICTGETRTVREFLDVAFAELKVKDWSNYVVVDPEFYRPAEVDFLLGDCAKATKVLGWKPEFTFEQLVEEMVNNDLHEKQ